MLRLVIPIIIIFSCINADLHTDLSKISATMSGDNVLNRLEACKDKEMEPDNPAPAFPMEFLFVAELQILWH